MPAQNILHFRFAQTGFLLDNREGEYIEDIIPWRERFETDKWKAVYAIGNALFYMNDYEASDAWFERWQTEEPKNFECAYEAAFHWFRREQPEKAGSAR